MVRGIHYFSAEVKPKLMSSQGAALILFEVIIFKHFFRLDQDILRTMSGKNHVLVKNHITLFSSYIMYIRV